MSQQTAPASQQSSNGAASDLSHWRGQTRVFLQPIAAPSILGLFGFAGATFMVSANLAGWYGNTKSGMFIFPFAMMFGGVAQFLAGMWAYKARDGLATAIHGMWGSFWIAYGILNVLAVTGSLALPVGGHFPELGYWFYVLGVITLLGVIGSLAESLGITLVLLPLAAGSIVLGYYWEFGGLEKVAAYLLMASALVAAYTAAALMFENSWGRVILPLGKYSKEANVPGGDVTYPLEFSHGEPGVKQGQ